ncbi:MAG: hypothetical protein ACXW2E_01700 [Nitrososphaeraceae archaeon]
MKYLNKPDPSFCIITPTAYLDQYATQSHTHLVLAHLVDANDEYANFYKMLSSVGDTIIIDNGAFELGSPYQPDKLKELGDKCGANFIVLPDYPGKEASVTIQAAKDWMSIMKDDGFKVMYVPQSKVGDRDNWIRGYEWGAGNDDVDMIGMSILGIPNALPHIPKSYARVVMTELLMDKGIFNKNKHHHYLGLNAAPNVELPSLLKMEALQTCDSSGPVWYGINGLRYNITLDSYAPIAKKYIREVDFDQPMTNRSNIHEAIQYNLDITLDIFNNPEKYI